MTQDDIIRMARECFADPDGSLELLTPELTEFAALIAAAQREKLAHWMRSMGYATGHGDTIEDLLDHLGTQIAEGLEVEVLMERKQYEHTLALQKASYEREIKIEVEAEREACADICDGIIYHDGKEADRCAAAIRARSKT
jgi:hypothetical protein